MPAFQGNSELHETKTNGCLRPMRHTSRNLLLATGFGVGLLPVHSPLLRESRLVSFAPLSDMLKFSGSSRPSRGRRINRSSSNLFFDTKKKMSSCGIVVGFMFCGGCCVFGCRLSSSSSIILTTTATYTGNGHLVTTKKKKKKEI